MFWPLPSLVAILTAALVALVLVLATAYLLVRMTRDCRTGKPDPAVLDAFARILHELRPFTRRQP